MKKLIYIIWAFCLGLQGCEQDPEYEYDDIDRIYFQYEVQNSLGNNVSVDSVVFSFGKLPEVKQPQVTICRTCSKRHR